MRAETGRLWSTQVNLIWATRTDSPFFSALLVLPEWRRRPIDAEYHPLIRMLALRFR
jgi:hypothetical protein